MKSFSHKTKDVAVYFFGNNRKTTSAPFFHSKRLTKKTEAVLAMLTEQVGYGYKVIEKQVLADSLPKKFAMNVENLLAIIAFLKENDYLVVKYQDKNEICLALTVKAETYLSQKKHVAEKSQISSAQVWLLFLGVFAAAFLGAMLANLLFR